MSLAAFSRLHGGYGSDFVPGVDVSGWQTPAQLEQSFSWARWAYIKATEGPSFFEPDTTAAHVEVCRRLRVPYGLYHFARPERGNVAAEVELFTSAIGQVGGPSDLPPVLDLESGTGDLDAYALTFLAGIEVATLRRPMIYVGPGFAQGKLSNPRLATYPLWLAHYANPGADAWVPAPWADWAVWQYADTTPEHGHLDINVARPAWLAAHGAGHLAAAADDGFGDTDRRTLHDLRRILGGTP